MPVRLRALESRRVATAVLTVLSVLPLMGGSCSAPPPPVIPRVSYEQKITWILWLEDQRVLRDPNPAPPPAAPPAKGRKPALAPPPDSEPDLVKLSADGDARIRRRAAIAIGRVGLPDGMDALVKLLADRDPEVQAAAAFAGGLLRDPRMAAALTTLIGDFTPADASRALAAGRAAEALGLLDEHVRVEKVQGFDHAAAVAAVASVARATAGLESVRAVAVDEMSSPLAPDIEAFRLALYALVRMQAYPEAAQAVLDENGQPKIRWWPVAYALQRLEDPRAVPALLTLLRADGGFAAAFAARGLGAMKDLRAVEPLIAAATKETRPAVRFRAVEALGRLGDARAIAPLVALLAQPSVEPTLRLETVTALGRLKAAPAYDFLLDLLSDPAPTMRIAAIRALAATDSTALVTVLSGMDVDSDWTVRAALVETLASLDSPTVERRLRSSLDDPDQRAIPAVLRALVRAKVSGVEKVLLERLQSEDLMVRVTAARLIGEVKPPGAAAALVAAYQAASADSVSDAREATLDALAAVGAPEARDTATRALADKDWSTRLHAARVLKRLDAASTAGPERPALIRLESEAYAKLTAPPYSPHVILDTSRGQITVELAVLDAPMTAHNFMALVRKGFYNGLRFHRVLGDFVAQAGDPRGDGSGGPGYSIRDELNDLPYLRGTIGMALSGPDTGGSQFFLTRSPQPHLDAKYTAFGRVVTGMDVVDKLQQGDTIDRARVWDGVTISGTSEDGRLSALDLR